MGKFSRSRQRHVRNEKGYSYLLYLPDKYGSQDLWPLILFLHGAGEKGNELDRLKKTGLPGKLETVENFPFIVISPQCPRGSYWSARSLGELLDDAAARYKVDPSRIYLTGISMGGYGAWDFAVEQPWRFAAIAPICGGGNPGLAERIKGIPVWAFHGDQDEIVPISESEVMVDALKRYGGNIRFTIYPDAGHDSWTRTYNDPELYEWFLSHCREPCRDYPGRREDAGEGPRAGL